MTKKEKKRKKKQKQINKKLCKRYPFLIPRSIWTGKVPKDYDHTYTEYDCIDKGWQIGFGKFLLEELRENLVESNYLNKFWFSQIKEKYGRLCLYNFGAPQKVYDVIDKYEFISEYVCNQCGNPKACIVDDYGWYLPLCEECWNKFNKKREKKGLKTISYEEAIGNQKPGLPDSYSVTSYSKDGNETIVHDISETTSKIMKAYEKRLRK